MLVSARATYLGLVVLLGLVGLALWALSARWVYLDARRREADPRPWLGLAIVLGVVGVLVWLLVRDNVAPMPERRPPPAATEEKRYGTATCAKCGTIVPFGLAEASRTWMSCPKCGSKVTV